MHKRFWYAILILFFHNLALSAQSGVSYFSSLNTFQKKAEQFLWNDEIEELQAYCRPFLDDGQAARTKAYAHFYAGEGMLLENDLNKAQDHFLESLKLFENSRNTEGLAAAHLKLGNIAFFEGNNQEAERHYTPAFDHAQQINAHTILYEACQNWATIYSNRQEFEKSMRMLKEALQAAQALIDPRKETVIFNQISTNYHSIGQLDSAIYYFKKLLDLKKTEADTAGLVSDLSTLGNLYSELGNHVQAQNYLVDAVSKAEQIRDTFSLMSLYTDISKVYSAQGIWSKAEIYAQKGIEMARAKGIQFIEAQNLKNYGYILEEKGTIEAALNKYKQALVLFQALNNPLNMVDIQIRIGNLLQSQEDYSEARQFLQEALSIRTQYDDKMGILDSKLLLGELDIRQKNYQKAIPLLETCISPAINLNNRNALMKTYRLLAEAHKGVNQFETALDYFSQYTTVKDSLLQIDRIREVNRIDAQFQTAKKDKEIAQQRAELERQKAQIQQRNYQNALLIAGLIIFMLLAGSFYFIYFKNKQLNKKKIEVLTKEQETQRLKSILEGEERERRRMARELHDGLGASLATVKMQISALSDKFFGIQEHKSYQAAENLIDDACQNVREISHNLMPTVLEEHGLEFALANVCERFGHQQKMEVEFIPYGLDQELEEVIQVAVFRCVQELLKNIAQHAQSSEVIVQITVEDKQLNLVVEDNGSGFDPEKIKEKEGIGIRNIRSRIEYLNGQLDIYSKKGEGSTFTIDIPL